MRILLIEDNEDDVLTIREMLAEEKDATFDLELTDCLGKGLTRLAEGKIDLVLLDLSLPDSPGLETFDKVQTHVPDVPIVVLTGLDDETMANHAVRRGAQDYLVKGRLDSYLLSRAARYAVERKYTERQLRAKTIELEAALKRIKSLESFLPICGWCKNIRDENNRWIRVEYYIRDRTGAEFTHAVCPDCRAKAQNDNSTPSGGA